MKIAIASSGLGHVARGIETWAVDTATALYQLSVNGYSLLGKTTDNQEQITNNNLSVTLFAAAPLPLPPAPCSLSTVILPSLKRGDRLTRLITRIAPRWTWRWGLTSGYDIEQRSFWRHLWPILRDGQYDILHVQDPLLADLCRRYREAGRLKTREILAHGTEEPASFLRKFPHVQHLAPWHLNETLRTLGLAEDLQGSSSARCKADRDQPSPAGYGSTSIRPTLQGEPADCLKSAGPQGPSSVVGRVSHPPGTLEEPAVGSLWTALPNFVDCEVFRPVEGATGKQQLRKAFGIPPEAFVVVSVAALKCGHKRVDHVIREFKAAAKDDWCLVLAGARTDETGMLHSLATGDPRIRLMPDTPRAAMPDLLRAADVMVLGSLFEMMPIAVLEGLATGLPVLCNNHPVLAWITGAEEKIASREGAKTRKEFPGGAVIDMARKGELAAALGGVTPEWIAEHGKAARERALAMFSTNVVIGQYVEYYRRVLGEKQVNSYWS